MTAIMPSNTVMAVVPDSNRISFSSTQCTTFQNRIFLKLFGCIIPGEKCPEGCFCKSVNKASLRRGQRNCKDLRSETFGKYYITPRGLLQVFAQQIPVQG